MVKCAFAVAYFYILLYFVSNVTVLRMKVDISTISSLFIDTSNNSTTSTHHRPILHQMLSRKSNLLAYAGIKPLVPQAKQLPECPATKEIRLASELQIKSYFCKKKGRR